MAKKWIQKAKLKTGSLHTKLNIPRGKNIPYEDLEVEPSDSTKLKHQKTLAKTLKRLHP